MFTKALTLAAALTAVAYADDAPKVPVELYYESQ